MLPQQSRVLDGASMNKSENNLRSQKAAVDVGRPLQNNEFQFGSFDYATMVKCGLISEPANISLQENEVTSGKSQFQFGSLDYSTMCSLSGVDSANASCKGKNRQTLLAASGEKDEKEKSSKNLSSSGLSGSSKVNETPKELKKGNFNVPSDPKQATKVLPPVRDNLLNNGVLKENSIHLSPKEGGTKENIKVPSADMELLSLGGHEGIFPIPTDISSPVTDNLLTNGVLEERSSVLPPKKDGTKATACDDFSAKVLLPRGLINGGNLCFLNATLQALLACLPFVQLLEGLRTRCPAKADYPTLGAFVEFIANFDLPPGSSLKRHGSAALQNGTPFSPSMFDSVLRNFSPDLPISITSSSGRPRQEDAQEFLSFVMDQMHNELLKLDGETQTASNGGMSSISSVDDDGWETVGPKNKTAITRTQSFVPSELSDIFGGQLRSLVKAKGSKASATIQPYLLLHLDICPDFVRNIEDAFHLFSSSENLEGYRVSHGKPGLVDASKSVKIQTLPKVMILHLMRFGYGANGSTKLLKPVRFPLEMTLGRELFVSYLEKRKYELVATITHHGRESSKGHYTADARHSNGQWLRYDDSSVFAISPGKVLHDQAYVLFYRQV